MLTTWTAFSTLDRMVDDVMRDIGNTAFGSASIARGYSPAVDVRSNDDEVLFEIDVPGVRQENLDVTLEGRTLKIRGERRYDGGDKDKVWLGRGYGAFERAFTLPEDLDTDHMAARLADGVLTLRIPRHARARPRRIEIGAGPEPRQLGEKSS